MAAINANRPFIPIYLKCDLEVNVTRVTSQDRISSTRTKLTDSAILRDLRLRCRLFEFKGISSAVYIDITNEDPGDVAKMILQYL